MSKAGMVEVYKVCGMVSSNMSLTEMADKILTGQLGFTVYIEGAGVSNSV